MAQHAFGAYWAIVMGVVIWAGGYEAPPNHFRLLCNFGEVDVAVDGILHADFNLQ
jgi:hypothetical protein